MYTFLEETLKHLKLEHSTLEHLVLILPSKRAGGFLKNHLRRLSDKTEFAPKIISIEDFLEDISSLKLIDSTELLFKSYEAYLKHDPESEKEDFESYATWATILLNDFSEIDRYLVDPKTFFGYLGSLKTLEKWNVKDEQTELIQKYLRFWDSLHGFYEILKSLLLNESIGYQGMLYRQAAEAIDDYVENKGDKKHVFIGFNALNKAEQIIIQSLLKTGNSDIFWDTDTYFQKDSKHSASLFIRKYLRELDFFKTSGPKVIASHFQQQKNFHFVEVQKNIGQAKYVGELLSDYNEEQLNNTAVVLADENLLVPILYSLPENVKTVNVTMGVKLKNFPVTVFFEQLLAQQANSSDTLYYKDVVSVLKHPSAANLVSESSQIVSSITESNKTHFSLESILEGFKEETVETLKLLFGNWQNNGSQALDSCIELILKLRKASIKHPLERVVLFELYNLFAEMKALQQKFPHVTSTKTVQSLYMELIASKTIDFEGDAYNGLQIMGILETRVLDFENVIITSVNEGVIPAGKSNASFITYDLKKEFDLPSYFEKDSIYTYHFYRLLHRAENIHLLYNNHSEGINTGEKSRFLLQLEIEKPKNHSIEKTVLVPKIEMEPQTLKTIEKTESVMKRLIEIAEKGFSPSALTSYIRNPLEFYFQKILRLGEFEEVEETVAANTLGTIVHDTLETFYKPFEDTIVTVEMLTDLKTKIPTEVTNQFIKTFKGGTFDRGKNLIIFEVAKRYVSNMIDFDISEIKAGNEIKIFKIEQKLTTKINIPKLDFPVNIGGKVDRVDIFNGQLRIIDYKTGKVEQRDVEILDWQEITQDYKYSKAFQVLAYATMMRGEIDLKKVEAGIISFKNMGSGFLRFSQKTKGSRSKDNIISEETINEYVAQLKSLILEICNAEIPFTEKIV